MPSSMCWPFPVRFKRITTRANAYSSSADTSGRSLSEAKSCGEAHLSSFTSVCAVITLWMKTDSQQPRRVIVQFGAPGVVGSVNIRLWL